MHKAVLFGLLLVGSAVCSVEIDIGRGYHEEVGIPLAESIKAAEEAALARAAEDIDSRIVGGAVAPSNAHPYLVIIFYFYTIYKVKEFFYTLKSSALQEIFKHFRTIYLRQDITLRGRDGILVKN